MGGASEHEEVRRVEANGSREKTRDGTKRRKEVSSIQIHALPSTLAAALYNLEEGETHEGHEESGVEFDSRHVFKGEGDEERERGGKGGKMGVCGEMTKRQTAARKSSPTAGPSRQAADFRRLEEQPGDTEVEGKKKQRDQCGRPEKLVEPRRMNESVGLLSSFVAFDASSLLAFAFGV